MFSKIRSLIFKLDPELAHTLAIKALKFNYNPVNNTPKDSSIETIMTFSMLLNLVETSNADSKELLWKFVKKYKKDIFEKNYPIFDNLISYAIKYFNDVIKKNKNIKSQIQKKKKLLKH